MKGVGAHDMMTVGFRIFAVHVIEDLLRALAIQRQLFAPFNDGLEVSVKAIFSIAQRCHMPVDARHQQPATDNSDRHPYCGDQQHFG